jgi:hydroxyethylthiazole kinase-like sugar kinase family protein
MAGIASAGVNIGTLGPMDQAMLRRHCSAPKGIPIVLDPVGAAPPAFL